MAVQTATNPDTGRASCISRWGMASCISDGNKPRYGSAGLSSKRQLGCRRYGSLPLPPSRKIPHYWGYGLETGKALLGGAAGLLESAATGASFILPEEAEQAARARIAEIGGGVQEAPCS